MDEKLDDEDESTHGEDLLRVFDEEKARYPKCLRDAPFVDNEADRRAHLRRHPVGTLVVRHVVPYTPALERLVLADILPRAFEPSVRKTVLTHDGEKLVSPKDGHCPIPNEAANSETLFYVGDMEGPVRENENANEDSYVYDAFMTAAARPFEARSRVAEDKDGDWHSLSWLLQGGCLLYDDPTDRIPGVYRHTAYVSLPGARIGPIAATPPRPPRSNGRAPQFATPGHCETYEISSTNVLLGFVIDTFHAQTSSKRVTQRHFRLLTRDECRERGLFVTILTPVQDPANLARMSRSWNAAQLKAVDAASSEKPTAESPPRAFDPFGERLTVRVLRQMIRDGVRFQRHVQYPGDLVIQNGWHLYIKPAGAVALARNNVTLGDLQRIVGTPITADRLGQKHDWWANMYDVVRGETPMVDYVYTLLAKARSLKSRMPVNAEVEGLVHQLEPEADAVDRTRTYAGDDDAKQSEEAQQPGLVDMGQLLRKPVLSDSDIRQLGQIVATNKRKRSDSDDDDASASDSESSHGHGHGRPRRTRAKLTEQLVLTPTATVDGKGYVWGALQVTKVAGKGQGVRAQVDLPKGVCLPVYGVDVPDDPYPQDTMYIIDSGRKGVLINMDPAQEPPGQRGLFVAGKVLCSVAFVAVPQSGVDSLRFR